MEREVKNGSRICQIPQGLANRTYEHQKPWPVIIAASLITILSISTLSNFISAPIIIPEGPDRYNVLLVDLDQDGNLIQNVIYNPSIHSDSIPYWGKIAELTNGGFAIAGYQEIEDPDSDPDNRQLWVIRTDDNYNQVWNRTYGSTFKIHSIAEMNNGDLAIGHYIEEPNDYAGKGIFQILVIDNEGEYVREQSWRFGWMSGFLHSNDGGFILAKMIYNTPNASPYWMARIDTDLSVIWNNKYPSFAGHADIVEDIAGGFTMPLCPGLDGAIGIVRLDNQGDEISRVFTNSTELPIDFWLIQCSNGEYLGWSGNYIIRFNIEGNILWEKYVDFYVHEIRELSLDRFVAFEAAGMHENEIDWPHLGVYLECFDAGGITIWTRSVQTVGFFVPDIISNTDGGLTILGMVASNYLSSVLASFSEPDAEAAYYLESSQFAHSLLCSDARFSQSVRALRTEAQKMVMD